MKALKITGVVQLIDIHNELEALQHAVDGYIETIGLPDGAVMIVDEEGRLKNKPVNRIASIFAGMLIVGTALIVGVDEDEFDDVPESYVNTLLGLSDELAKEE